VIEPARGEEDRLGRRLIEPVHVVDEREDRPLLSRGAEEAERRGRACVPLRRPVRLQREAGAKRCGLRFRNPVDQVEDRSEQICETREGETRLGLDPARRKGRHAFRAGDRVPQELCLADPRVTDQYEHGAAPASRRVEQRVDPGAFRVPSQQPHGPSLGRKSAEI
jgi:hypothetical protein